MTGSPFNRNPRSIMPLRGEYPLLFANIMAIAGVLLALGFLLIFTPPLPSASARSSILQLILPLRTWGIIFLLNAVWIILGLIFDAGYKILRLGLVVAVGIITSWTLSLLYAALNGNIRNLSAVILWAYLNYNLFKAVTDKGFSIVSLVKTINKREEDE